MMTNPKVIVKKQLTTSLDYLEQLIEVVEENDLYNYQLNENTRKTAEILLHQLRSAHYYLRGVTKNTWEYLDYTTEKYTTIGEIKDLMNQIRPDLQSMIELLDSDQLHKQFENQGGAFGLNLIIENMYHLSHHFGQLQVYLHANQIQPPEYSFLI